MKLFLTLSFVLSCCVIWAQPIITSGDIRPMIGDKFTGLFYSVDTMDYTAGPSGANVTWDFSNLQDSLPNDLQGFFDTLSANPILTFEIVDPSTALFADSFPDAEFSIFSEINIFGSFQSNTFIDETPSGFVNLGDVSITSIDLLGQSFTDTSVTVNVPPVVLIPLPLAFGANTSSTSFTIEEDFTGTINNEITEVDSLIVDAYGTLITPWQTYNEVLRVTQYTETTTVSTLLGTGQAIDSTVTTDVSYTWYTKGSFAPVMDYSFSEDEEGEIVADLFAFVPDDFVITSTRDRRLPDFPVTIYPNPVQESIQLNFELPSPTNNLSVSIYNINGQLVQQSIPNNFGAGTNNLQLSLNPAVGPGNYVIELLSEDFVVRKKISVQ